MLIAFSVLLSFYFFSIFFFKSLLNLLQYCFYVYWLWGMWDPNSLTRDWTHISCVSCMAGEFFTGWAKSDILNSVKSIFLDSEKELE